MKVGIVATGVMTCLGLVLGLVWLTRTDVADSNRLQNPLDAESPLTPSQTGPWPRAVFEKTEFEFGKRETGDDVSAEFEVRNDGEAPLRMRQEMASCRCTISHLEPRQIEPGESARVKLTWLPSDQSEVIDKALEIRTNDPQLPLVRLSIIGQGVPPLAVYPQSPWDLRELSESKPTEFTALITSSLHEKFSLTSLEAGHPALSLTATAVVDPDKLAARGAISGYQVQIVAKPIGPVGYFTMPVKLRTDLTSQATGEPVEIDALVTGLRRGPFYIRGREWGDEDFTVGLGQIDSKAGKRVTLSLLARDEPSEGLQFTEVACDPDFIKVTLTRDENDQRTPRRHLLTIECPPGSPRATRGDRNPGFLRIKSNHPAAPEIVIQAFFNSF